MSRTVRRATAAAFALVAGVLPFTAAADAAVVQPSVARSGKLVQVGPIVAEHGFPAWYRDSNNVRLEACVSLDDPLCPALADEVPDPEAPIAFPGNFPGEFFYQLDSATLTLTGGAKAVISMNVEAAFANDAVVDGDQMVFGRIRIRFDAPAGERYRITHPYGVDDLVATDKKGVNLTEDAGAVAGAFGQALNGRIGPFLKWDPAVAPAAPAGYVGDPGVNHKIVGSPYDTNYIKIEKLDPATGAVLQQVGFTDQFSVQGRYATNAGVDVDQATYSLGADGTGVLEVFANSEPGQAIELTGMPALGFRTTALRGGNGRYYARVPITGPVPPGTKIQVVNAGDRPIATKSRAVTDVVRVDGVRYDADAQTLTVAATSSDAGNPALTVAGFGRITGAPFTGVAAPPANVTVTSADGGSATAPVTGSGQTFVPGIPVAAATANTPAVTGQVVKLDGTGSAGEIDSYAWTQTAGPAATLTGDNSPQASFVPTQPGTYAFQLQVRGPGGAPAPATVSVEVIAQATPRADAGPDQTAIRGRAVQLDASKSANAETYSWRQVAGPAVTLSGTTTAKPTFTFPAQALPAAPGPNAAYAFDNSPVVLELTVTNPAGTSVVRTTVRPAADQLSGITVRYRTGNNEWRISGTSGLIAGQRLIAVLGKDLTGRVIGTPVAVDATGAFSLRVTGPAPGALTTVSLVTTTGGVQLNFPVSVTN